MLIFRLAILLIGIIIILIVGRVATRPEGRGHNPSPLAGAVDPQGHY